MTPNLSKSHPTAGKRDVAILSTAVDAVEKTLNQARKQPRAVRCDSEARHVALPSRAVEKERHKALTVSHT